MSLGRLGSLFVDYLPFSSEVSPVCTSWIYFIERFGYPRTRIHQLLVSVLLIMSDTEQCMFPFGKLQYTHSKMTI